MIVADLLETIVAAARRRSSCARARTCRRPRYERRIERRPRATPFERRSVRRTRPGSSPSANGVRRPRGSCGRLRPRRARAAYVAGRRRGDFRADGTDVLRRSLDHLTSVRAAVGSVPLLRKDFLSIGYQLVEAAAHGADAALLIAGALDDRIAAARCRGRAASGLAALVEVHDGEELRRAIGAGAEIVGVNSRNLRTLSSTCPCSRM